MSAYTDEFERDPDDGLRGWNTDEHCPWCKKPVSEVYEHTRRGEEDFEFDCPHCEKPIQGSVWTQFILQRPEPKP